MLVFFNFFSFFIFVHIFSCSEICSAQIEPFGFVICYKLINYFFSISKNKTKKKIILVINN